MDADRVMSSHPVLFSEPKNLKLPAAHVTFTVGGDASKPIITVSTDHIALYVTLTTLAQGRFSDNAFLLLPGEVQIEFLPFAGFDLVELKTSLRVEHVETYMQ